MAGLVAVIAAGASIAAASEASSAPGAPREGRLLNGSPSVAIATLAQTATREFTNQTSTEANALRASVASIGVDVARGDTITARRDELAAQAAYDGLRTLVAGDPVNAASLDELAGEVVPGTSFAGLHAVERDLWTTGPTAFDLQSLTTQADVARFLLARVRLDPEVIGVVAVDELNWVADEALPADQEQFSGLGLIDVTAGIAAAERTFGDVAPLGRTIAPAATARVAAGFAALDATVGSLGNSTVVPELMLTPSVRRVVTGQLDATATELASLAAALTPFGTHGLSPYTAEGTAP